MEQAAHDPTASYEYNLWDVVATSQAGAVSSGAPGE